VSEAGPADAGLRKGDRTRLAIRTAARRQFEQLGYDRASIRAIATEARIDPSMVMRYFGSKAGLFAAAVDVDLQLPDLAGWPPAERGRALVEHFLARWEGALSDDVLVLLLRSAVSNEAAAERLRALFMGQVATAVRLVAPAAEAGHRAGLIATQMVGLAMCRYVLALPEVTGRSAAELADDLGPTIQRYLAGELPVRPAADPGRTAG
jgi:AcrR family transcriptional regulator